MTIDKKGVVNIIDTKTKKISALAVSDTLAYPWPVSSSPYTDSKFMETGNRNTYDNWDLQLGVYERMLNSLGIETDEKIIINLLYAGEYFPPHRERETLVAEVRAELASIRDHGEVVA